MDDLLAQLDGRTVKLRQGTVELQTAGLEIREIEPTRVERFLNFIADPNIAFTLLTLGVIGIFVEYLLPGLWGPGILGVMALALGLVALGNLPVNWVGAALMAFGAVLLAVEMHALGFGIFGVSGGISFVIGAFLLFGGIHSSPDRVAHSQGEPGPDTGRLRRDARLFGIRRPKHRRGTGGHLVRSDERSLTRGAVGPRHGWSGPLGQRRCGWRAVDRRLRLRGANPGGRGDHRAGGGGAHPEGVQGPRLDSRDRGRDRGRGAGVSRHAQGLTAALSEDVFGDAAQGSGRLGASTSTGVGADLRVCPSALISAKRVA